MNRVLMSLLVLVAVALGAMPAQAVTIGYNTSGSNADVILFPTSSGDITQKGTFNLTEQLLFGDTSNGHYGEAYTYIPFVPTFNGYLDATVTDMSVSNPSAMPLDWLKISLYSYTGSGTSYLGCAGGSSLCTLEAYDSVPPTASIFAALVAGTQYLLQVGFGLCGCSGEFAGIQLTVTNTPIPPAILMFISALLSMGGLVWRRRRVQGAVTGAV